VNPDAGLIGVPGTTLEIYDLGPALNAVFFDFYGGRGLALARLAAEAEDYLDTHPNPDELVFNFTLSSLPRPHATLSQLALWDWVLQLLHGWEDRHRPRLLHKGAAYYFAAMRDVIKGDLDLGFLNMHQALQEDIRTYGTGSTTPAAAFVTLDAGVQDQAFRVQVQRYEGQLVRRLDAYRRGRRGHLTLAGLRGRVNRDSRLRVPFLALAFVVARFEHLQDAEPRRVLTNEIAGFVVSRVLLDLAQIVEGLLDLEFGVNLRTNEAHTFARLADQYVIGQGLALPPRALFLLGGEFDRRFEPTMRKVMAGRAINRIGASIPRAEADLVITYGLRNHTAHGISRSPSIAVRFERLLQREFYALFALLESRWS
jgi:hypothetical protein